MSHNMKYKCSHQPTQIKSHAKHFSYLEIVYIDCIHNVTLCHCYGSYLLPQNAQFSAMIYWIYENLRKPALVLRVIFKSKL